MTIDRRTLRAYEETAYLVLADPEFTLTIGKPSPELAALHEALGVATSAFVTAWNPRGLELDRARNDALLAMLARELAASGYSAMRGVGRHPSNGWPAEESFLVPGMALDEAKRCGDRFEQNAIVWSGRDATPGLIVLR